MGLTWSWIITILVLVVFIGVYAWMFFYARKRQKKWDEQYTAMKERHEIFVLNKKIVKERPQSKWLRYTKFKTYQVVGRLPVSQTVRGVQMSKMHTMTFQTTKSEFEKIQNNHKYKMDVAGNYIGYVHAPAPVKTKAIKKSKVSVKNNAKSVKSQKSGKATK